MTSGLRALLPFARPARGRFALAAVLAAAAALLSLVPFWAIARAVDSVVDGAPSRAELGRLAAVALGAVVARFVLFALALYISHLAAYEVLFGVRLGMAEHLAAVPLGYVDQRRSGELKKVMGDDVERLELFLAHGIPDLASAAVTIVAVGIWMAVVDWRMAIAALGVVVPAMACMSVAMRRSGEHMHGYQTSLAEMNSSITELIRGMPVVKVFNRAEDEVRGAERSIRDYVSVVRRYSLDFLPFGTAFFVLMAANVVAIVPLGLWLHDRGSLSTADLLFFFIVGLGALGPVLALLHLFTMLAHVASGGNLVNEVMAAAELDDRDADQRPSDASVELRGVTFSYGAEPVLHDVSIRVRPGTVCALVGPSGAGKSTVAALIARFWDVDDGAVLVGGADVRRISTDDLTRHVALVLQQPFLFDDTIAENLRVARPAATDAELEVACRAARAHEFVTALDGGYGARVGERGARLSGGERQRLTIARAILADAPVIVLDEATAFTDPENEAAIQDAISELVVGRTVVVIAHRLSTIVDADQIVVLDRGRVVEEGRHDALVAVGGVYARMWDDYNRAVGTSVRGSVDGVTA